MLSHLSRSIEYFDSKSVTNKHTYSLSYFYVSTTCNSLTKTRKETRSSPDVIYVYMTCGELVLQIYRFHSACLTIFYRVYILTFWYYRIVYGGKQDQNIQHLIATASMGIETTRSSGAAKELPKILATHKSTLGPNHSRNQKHR